MMGKPPRKSARGVVGVVLDRRPGPYPDGERMRGDRQLDPQGLGDHIDRLYRAAWALCGSREEAEDLVQETFARVLRKPRVLRSDDDVGYLLRVLRNTFVSQRRTASRQPRAAPLPEDLDLVEDPHAVKPESGVESKELYAAISALPDEFRDALVAVDVVGLSYREAARALRVREATITTRLHRARQRVVRSLLGDDALAPKPRPSR
jgi:RNA polymerase sigma-70 factor, ECF subfamily